MDKLIYRKMDKNDLGGVCILENLAFPSLPWSRKSFEEEMDNSLAVYFVAEDREKGVIAGYAGMWVIFEEAHVTNVAVHPDYRRHGIGKKILFLLIEESIREGCTRMSLEVREGNEAARELYAKAGFREAGLRKHYYEDNKENAVIMWLDYSGLEQVF